MTLNFIEYMYVYLYFYLPFTLISPITVIICSILGRLFTNDQENQTYLTEIRTDDIMFSRNVTVLHLKDIFMIVYLSQTVRIIVKRYTLKLT